MFCADYTIVYYYTTFIRPLIVNECHSASYKTSVTKLMKPM
jgi:hypothetical protein